MFTLGIWKDSWWCYKVWKNWNPERNFEFFNEPERHINNYLKSLGKLGSQTNDQYQKIKAIRSRPEIFYGLCKVHKVNTDVCLSFRPILLLIGTPSYKLVKFLVPKLSSVMFNEFTAKVFFAFAKEIVYQDGKIFMGSLDVDSLFSNIPLKRPSIFLQICYIT